MTKLEFEGRTYINEGGKWVTENYMVAPDSVQRELNNKQFEVEFNACKKSGEYVDLGDRYKNAASEHLALRCYMKALERADADYTKFLLPRITSSLRKQGKAREAIDLCSELKKKYGSKIFGPVALTSIAAAYCDLGEYYNAKKCCKKAYTMSDGESSGELMGVYGRIKSESNVYE